MSNLPSFNSKIRPNHFPHHFDAHIYFDFQNDLQKIQELKEKCAKEFADQNVFIGNIIPAPIGPHPLPMLEINFSKDVFSHIVFFLMQERQNLNILIHPISDNDYLDHTSGALWLGQSLQLNLSLFK